MNKIKNFFSEFTFVEVMIIVAICGILAAVAIPQFQGKDMTPRATITFSTTTPETRNTVEMVKQIDIYQQQYGISELDLPTVMRNENQKEWYFPW